MRRLALTFSLSIACSACLITANPKNDFAPDTGRGVSLSYYLADLAYLSISRLGGVWQQEAITSAPSFCVAKIGVSERLPISFAFAGKVYVLSGAEDRAVYSSSDMISWTKDCTTCLPDVQPASAVAYNGQAWMISDANVYRSGTPGTSWTTVTTSATHSGTRLVTFQSKLFAIGSSGAWSSTDGNTWSQTANQAAVFPGEASEGSFNTALVFKNRMYAIKTRTLTRFAPTKQTATWFAVTSSADGVTWRFDTSFTSPYATLPIQTTSFEVYAYNGQIFIMNSFFDPGGRLSIAGDFGSSMLIFTTADGTNWTRIPTTLGKAPATKGLLAGWAAHAWDNKMVRFGATALPGEDLELNLTCRRYSASGGTATNGRTFSDGSL